MDKAMFTELLDSIKEMDSIAKGKKNPARVFNYPIPQVQKIRHDLGLSQYKFAQLIGVSSRTLENWEQGRRHPTGPAIALLKILAVDPKHALHALHEQSGE